MEKLTERDVREAMGGGRSPRVYQGVLDCILRATSDKGALAEIRRRFPKLRPEEIKGAEALIKPKQDKPKKGSK